MSATDALQVAIFNLEGAITILGTAIASGLAASPATATAAGPFTVAGDRFQDALSQPDPWTPASTQLQLRDLRDGSYARAREAVAISFVPWPVVFVPLGFLLDASKKMLEAARALLAAMSSQRVSDSSELSTKVQFDALNPFLGPLHTMLGAKE